MKVVNILKRFFYTEGATPLPIGICLLFFALTLFNAFTMTSVYSYLPRLVKEFGISEVDTGKKVGLIASSMYIGRIFSSLLWGYICDKCGRKSSLLISGGCLVISTMMFSFSFNYNWTLVTRFLQGFSMGITVTTKAYMTDICDDSNMATGLSVIFAGYNIGLLFGTSMAGFLVFPVEKYPSVFKKDSFFETYKIFIPNFIIGFGLALQLLLSIIILPKRTSGDKVSLCVQDDKEASGITTTIIESNYSTFNCSNSTDQLISKNSELQSEKSILLKSKPHILNNIWMFLKTSNIVKLLRNKDFILSAILYAIHTFFINGYDELFPVYVSTSIEYGGLGMSTSEIGIIYLFISVGLFITQMSYSNKMISKFGAKKMFIVSCVLSGVFIPLIPVNFNIKNKTLLFAILWMKQLLILTNFVTCYTAVNILINNSVGSDLLGIANGVGLSVSCIGRSLGTYSIGSMYTWSLEKKGRPFPFNIYFTFFMLLLISILVSIFPICLPESLNRKKKESE